MEHSKGLVGGSRGEWTGASGGPDAPAEGAPATASAFDDEFLMQARKRLEQLEDYMQGLDAQLAELQSDRSKTALMIRHLRGLLSVHAEEGGGALTQVLLPSAGGRGDRGDDADQVVEYLKMRGEATHYRKIYDDLKRQGIVAGGKDPALTLLSRYYNDGRLIRVGRGTYIVKPE